MRPTGSSEGGSFSLFLQYYMKPELLFDVPPEKFLPAPKVTSAVIRCVRRERPAVDVADEGFFFKVMRGGFLLRRKTLPTASPPPCRGFPRNPSNRPSPIWACLRRPGGTADA